MPENLTIQSLQVSYGKVKALRDICVEVRPGSITGIIGANGAGKSTILKAVSGLVPVESGEIRLGDQRIDGLPPHKIVELGIVQVPEGGRIFPHMSVLANLKSGAYLRRDKPGIQADLERIFRRFPILRERQSQTAQTLSGGEQRMLGIARALMAGPKVLLMDEPSWGLSPLVVEELARIISEISGQGITVLLVEQNAGLAFNLTEYAYVLEVGRVVLDGNISEIKENEIVYRAFLG